jgi:hypothetical protein
MTSLRGSSHHTLANAGAAHRAADRAGARRAARHRHLAVATPLAANAGGDQVGPTKSCA